MAKTKTKLPPEFEGVEMFDISKHKDWLAGGSNSKPTGFKTPVRNSVKYVRGQIQD